MTGDQAVIIPEQNVENLMLKDEVIEAVEDGKFHIHAIKNVDQAIQLMMDKDAEQIHEKVNNKLKELAKQADQFSDKENEDE